jgi:hypothetical protein
MAKRRKPMTPGRREWLVTTYLAHEGRTEPLSRTERLREASTQGHTAWEMVNDLVDNDAEAAWSILLELVQRARTSHQLGMIAAGPLEYFISTHWQEWIGRVEVEARRDRRLRYCLSGINASTLPEAYAARVRRLANRTLPEDLTSADR